MLHVLVTIHYALLQALARKPHQEVVMVVLLLSNMGLFLVDHIHFQVSSVPPNTGECVLTSLCPV